MFTLIGVQFSQCSTGHVRAEVPDPAVLLQGTSNQGLGTR